MNTTPTNEGRPERVSHRPRRTRAPRHAVGLAVVLAAAAGPLQAFPGDDGVSASAFVAAWRQAVERPGGEAIADLTALPFLFEGRALPRAAFVARAVPALFRPAARRCLQRARPVAEDARLVVTCAGHGYVFARTPSGWRFAEFFADSP